jgi:hypothetical protein
MVSESKDHLYAHAWVAIKDWFSELTADFYDAGIQKYDKCLNLYGNYVEK